MLRAKQPLRRCTIEDWPALELRGFYFDLTRQVPTTDFLKAIVDRLAEAKINLLMIQYREFFPYEGLPFIVSKSSYTRREISEFVKYAADRHIRVVPLLQSLSFQEHILRAEAYVHLREDPDDISGLCPTHPESLQLYTELAGQLLDAHPDAGTIHIGADEADKVGQCERCQQAMVQGSKATLVTGFTNQVIRFLLDRGVTPMMWADMFFGHFVQESDVSQYVRDMFGGLSREVVAVDWDYWSTDLETPPAHRSPYPGMAGLSHVERLVDEGFTVVGAPSCSSGSTAEKNGLNHLHPFDNITAFASELIRLGCLGIVNTFWPTDAVGVYRPGRDWPHHEVVDLAYRQVRPGLEAHWYSIWRGAECAWTDAPRGRRDYDRAFGRIFLGAEKPTYPEALALSSFVVGTRASAEVVRRIRRGVDRMGQARKSAGRRKETVAYSEAYARIHLHELEWELFSNSLPSMGAKALSQARWDRLRALADERKALERTFRRTYLSIYKDVHLEEEVQHRFVEERRLQEQLMLAQRRGLVIGDHSPD
ncbi:MAG: family 20 glycosylhydrolase [Candidatus Latescibacteria bacterium]|jgi:hypothetical protein|nr:family 20 glycosylhydrolase [Candidatus Latescibacterota bacterium]